MKLNNRGFAVSGVIYNGVIYKPYLACQNYHSKVLDNKEQNIITLRGDEVFILARGMDFNDPGYISNDKVEVIGNIGTEEGIYDLYYKAKNSEHSVTRKVIIIDNSSLKNMFPTITLEGDETIYLVKNIPYRDPGVKAYDSIDGDITDKVINSSDINVGYLGEYKVNYMVTNSKGLTYSINRKVQVVDTDSELVISSSLSTNYLTNENVTIKLSINNEYDKIKYPDGTEGRELNYIVNTNGRYVFKIFDIYGRVKELEVIVNNIDKTLPDGACIANTFYGRTEVILNLGTSKNVNSYDYIIDRESTGFIQSQKYVTNKTNINSVTVVLKDSANNKHELLCNVVDKTKRVVTTDAKGKNCLDGYTCYVQFDYGNVSKYPYCSMSNNPKSCGGIGRSGCSITSVSIATTYEYFGVHSKNGLTYTPFTIWEEVYPVNHTTGQCNGGCSAWTRMKEAVIGTGLSAAKVKDINKVNMPEVLEHLKKGYPVVVHSREGAFTDKGHYMTLIGYRWEDGYVFLSDPAQRDGTKKRSYKGKMYYVDTWISPNDLITGQVDNYMLVGPKGMF